MPNLKVREYMVSYTKDRKVKKVRAVESFNFTNNYISVFSNFLSSIEDKVSLTSLNFL